jgi:hypothetical protein
VSDETAPPAVDGSSAASYHLGRDCRAADAGSLRRMIRRHRNEFVTAAMTAALAIACCGFVGVLFAPAALKPFGRLGALMLRRRRIRRGRALRPSEPWTWDGAWVNRSVSQPVERTRRGRSRLLRGLVLLLAAGLLAVAFRFVLPIAVVFGVPSAVLLWLGYRDVRAGSLLLSSSSWPLFTGERAELMLGVSDGGARFDRATATLRCVEEFPGRKRPVWCTWTEYRAIERDDAPGPGHDALLTFDIPASAPGTRLDVPDACWWELEVFGETDAGKVREKFVVPIYERPAPGVPPAA